MAGPADYRVLRQSRWGEQTVYMVLHLQQTETFHVIDEPVGWPAQGLDHPALPRSSARHEGNGIRQTWLPLLTGKRLTELRAEGSVTGAEIAAALEAVTVALQHLATYRPSGVPAIIDPDCVCRLPSGEWVIDYAMLAHNPEVRRARQTVGVFAVGLLFYWLVTGEFPRLGRPTLTGRFPPLSTTLLLPLIKAINESYPGLAELQQALIDCRRAGGFDRLAEYLNRPVTSVKWTGRTRPRVEAEAVAPVQTAEPAWEGVQGAAAPDPAEAPQEEAPPSFARSATPGDARRGIPGAGPWAPHDPKAATETLVGLAGRPLAAPPPEIPLRDPSWAPAPWHAGELPRRPARRAQEAEPSSPWLRPVFYGAGGAVLLLLITLAVLRPWQIPPRLPEANPGLPAPGPGSQPDPVSPRPEPGPPDPGSEPGPGTTDPVTPPQSETPIHETPPEGGPALPPPESLPPLPPAPEPAAGSMGDLDRQAGGAPHLIYINGEEVGWAWLLEGDGPYLSLGAFNALFHRTLYWVPLPENRARILNATFVYETGDVQMIRERLWLRLTPEVQRALKIQLIQRTEGRLFFQS